MKVKTLSIALITAIALFSCKKVDTEQFAQENSASVQKIKDWYAKIPATPNNLTATKNINALPKGMPDWTRVSYDQLEKTYTIPVTISSKGTSDKASAIEYLIVKEDGKGNITSGSYSMVIIDKTKADAITEGKINLKLLSIKQAPANFNGAVLQYNMNNEFIDAGHYENGQLKSKTDQSTGKPSGIVSNNMPLPDCGGQEVCIDWYWQHFENGVLMWEVYLYTTCNCVGNGGGSGGDGAEACENTFNTIIASMTPLAIKSSSTKISESSTTRVRDYSWKCFGVMNGFGTMAYLTSHEIGTQEKGADGKWHWADMQHSNISPTGTTIFDIIGTTNSWYKVIGTGALDNKISMNLNFNVKLVYTCYATVNESRDYFQQMPWDINDGWTPGGNQVPDY